MVRLLSAVLLVSAGAAWAQAKPSVMLFPLEFKRVPAAMPKADRDGLVSDAERLLRVAGAQLPDLAKGEAALADLKRQDCEREDACLQQLAQKAETLYALYVNVDFKLEGQVVVTGRVVRDDGKLVSPLQTVMLPKGANEKHRDIAKNALTGLYDLLKVKDLPAVREVAQPVAVLPPPVVTELPPPPPPVEVKAAPAPSPSGLKLASYVALGAGGVALIAGSALALGANPGLRDDGVILLNGQPPDEAVRRYESAKTQQAVGAGLAIGGAVVAAGGLVLMLVSNSSTPPPVSVAPVSGGAVVTWGGTLP